MIAASKLERAQTTTPVLACNRCYECNDDDGALKTLDVSKPDAVTPSLTPGVTGVTVTAISVIPVTPVTPKQMAGVTDAMASEAPQMLGFEHHVTPVTPVTPENGQSQLTALRVHFDDMAMALSVRWARCLNDDIDPAEIEQTAALEIGREAIERFGLWASQPPALKQAMAPYYAPVPHTQHEIEGGRAHG